MIDGADRLRDGAEVTLPSATAPISKPSSAAGRQRARRRRPRRAARCAPCCKSSACKADIDEVLRGQDRPRHVHVRPREPRQLQRRLPGRAEEDARAAAAVAAAVWRRRRRAVTTGRGSTHESLRSLHPAAGRDIAADDRDPAGRPGRLISICRCRRCRKSIIRPSRCRPSCPAPARK